MADYTNTPIIVTGCARSGTSLVAGIISLCGAWTGKVTGPTQWNKKGQFENEYIRDHLTKPYLRKIGVDPMGQNPLPTLDQIQPEPDWRDKVTKAMRDQGYPWRMPWMFKGAKACLIWPVWHTAFPDAKWVIVRREDEKNIDSCMRTSFMRKHKTREGWQCWIDHHKQCFQQMVDADLDVYEIWPSANLEYINTYWALINYLRLTWNEKAVREFIDPNLWGR